MSTVNFIQIKGGTPEVFSRAATPQLDLWACATPSIAVKVL